MNWLKYSALLLLPLLVVVGVNELVRSQMNQHGDSAKFRDRIGGIATINPTTAHKTRCTWTCHNRTSHCKKHHVKIVASQFKVTDKIYFGIIGAMQQTGNYQLANLIVLAVAIPLLVWFLVAKSLILQRRIKAKENG